MFENRYVDPRQEPKSFSIFVLLPASMLDLFATSLMYVGLTLTSASSFQVTSSANIGPGLPDGLSTKNPNLGTF
jgi:hypothetical protein